MKVKLLLTSLTAVVTSIAVGVAGTYALFTAQQTSDQNFTAGSLCIDSARDTFDNVPGPMFYMTGAQGSNGIKDGRYPMGGLSSTSPPGFVPETPGGWAPGDKATRTLTVFNGRTNCYSMDAKLTRLSAELTPDSYVPLADKMMVTVLAQAPGGGFAQVAKQYLSEFLKPGGVEIWYPGPLPITLPGYSPSDPTRPNLQMQFTVELDPGLGNDFQDRTLIVHFTVHAEQLANNP